jgi:hypothetical protein
MCIRDRLMGSDPCTVVGVALVFSNSDVELTPYWQGSAGNRHA